MHTQGRYHRQEILAQFGREAQEKLARASVLVAGAGGLGCPVLQYLAAAGVGRLGVVDGDVVSLTNLHRQVLYDMDDIGKEKATVAVRKLRAMNPELQFDTYVEAISKEHAAALVQGYDLVVDCTDNFPTRYLLNDVCVLLGKPLVYGAVSRFEGQVAVFNVQGSGQYRDLFPEMPKAHEVQNCEEAGVVGVLPGIIGTLMAMEALKWITGVGALMTNQVLTYHALTNQFLTLQYSRGGQYTGPADLQALLDMNYDLSCSSTDLLQWMRSGDALLVDVREQGELPLVSGFPHLQIPLGVLETKLSELRGRRVVLFCKSGVRSEKGAGMLREQGIDAYHVKLDLEAIAEGKMILA